MIMIAGLWRANVDWGWRSSYNLDTPGALAVPNAPLSSGARQWCRALYVQLPAPDDLPFRRVSQSLRLPLLRIAILQSCL